MGRKKKSKAKNKQAPVTKATTDSVSTAATTAGSHTTDSACTEVEWPVDKTNQNKLLTALKYQTLGPFLFAQRTLSHEAEVYAVDASLLPKDEGVWPAFFEQSQWRNAELIVHVVLTSFNLCEINQSFRDYLLTGKSTILKDGSMVATLLKLHSKMMTEYSTSEVEVVYKILRLQVSSLCVVGVSSPAYLFFDSLHENEQLVLPIKERGNTNFKESRYRAAIGDYTRAIRLSPYSSVLYCNRALCYLKNGDTWNACVDSYRALVLKSDWGKPYYRCSEAWMLLGNLTMAMQMNGLGCDMCPTNSDLSRQKREIMAAIEKQESVPQTPPTGHTSKTKLSMVNVEQKQGEKGERSISDSTHSQSRTSEPSHVTNEASHVTNEVGHVANEVTNEASHVTNEVTDEVGHVTNEVGHVSDHDDITEHIPLNHDDHSVTTTEGEVPREPIEDENEWEFRHTRAPGQAALARQTMRLHDMRNMFNMDRRPGHSPDWLDNDNDGDVAGGVVTQEISPEVLAELQAKEMATYRKKERERERLKVERQAMRTAEERKLAHTLPPADPFTNFENLQAPNITNDISTTELFAMIKHVPSKQLIGRQYTSYSEAWLSLEPLLTLHPPIRPKPPATTFTGTFDEVWCPMLAGVTETDDIIPPRIHYVGNMVTKYIAHYPPHYHRYEL